MSNKNVTLQDKAGNNLYPVTLSSNVTGLSGELNNKANKDLSNVTYPTYTKGSTTTGTTDRVIEQFVSSDGLTWYRKWASGWKECGGVSATNTSDWQNITTYFPIQFTNLPTLSATLVWNKTDTNNASLEWVNDLKTTNFKYRFWGSSSQASYIRYYACGY